ncbi:MAG: protein-tyrosine-phosphatase [Nevskia sp.]|nr:protein-tyrosine-phosphatase [Nevskia sp.]
MISRSLDSSSGSLRLQGIPNFRDIGGCSSRDGRRLRYGRIYRSAVMHRLDAADLQRLHAVGIGMVCDLRGAEERARAPHSWLTEMDLLDAHIDVNNRSLQASADAIVNMIASEPDAAKLQALMEQNYRRMPEAFFGHCRPAIDFLLSEPPQPLVIHCTAGKDRTGFLAALLLFALDIEESAIYRDYLLSAQSACVAAMWLQGKTLLAKALERDPEPHLIEVVCGVRQEYLAAAIDQLLRDYGSIDGYLEDALGLTPRRRRQLQQHLLE